MDMSNYFRLANLAVGGLMIAGAVGKAISYHSFTDIIITIYVIIFGLATIGLEYQIPPQVARYASFMFSFIGRGIFYVFVGTIELSQGWAGPLGYILGSIVALVGLGYVVLEFMPQIEPPFNMREADAGWGGAEQV